MQHLVHISHYVINSVVAGAAETPLLPPSKPPLPGNKSLGPALPTSHEVPPDLTHLQAVICLAVDCHLPPTPQLRWGAPRAASDAASHTVHSLRAQSLKPLLCDCRNPSPSAFGLLHHPGRNAELVILFSGPVSGPWCTCCRHWSTRLSGFLEERRLILPEGRIKFIPISEVWKLGSRESKRQESQ